MTQTQTEASPDIPVGQAIGGALGQAELVLAGLLVIRSRRPAPTARPIWPCSGLASSVTPPPGSGTSVTSSTG